MQGFQDPTKSFLIRKAVQGIARLAPSYDVRLPITESILIRICDALTYLVDLHYERKLFKAIFTTAFYSLARIGELVNYNGNHLEDLIQLSDLNFEKNGEEIIRFFLTFRTFKHNAFGKPHVITVDTLQSSQCCPVNHLHNYLSLRGPQAGCLFLTANGLPLSRRHFDNITQRCLRFCDLDLSRYKGHSFRIGGASYAATKGFSDAQIRLLGRWKSDAFRRYIRSPAVTALVPRA